MRVNKRIPDFPEPTCRGLRRWFRSMHEADLLYHPDEPAESVVRIHTGEACFTPAECLQLNAAIESMFATHGDAVYTVVLYFARKGSGITLAQRHTAASLVC